MLVVTQDCGKKGRYYFIKWFMNLGLSQKLSTMVVFGSLLAACKLHKNIKLGEWALIKKLCSLF